MKCRQLLCICFVLLQAFPLFSQVSLPYQIDLWAKQRIPEALTIHRSLVSIPNDAQFPADMDKNIAWLQPAFEERGFEVKVLATSHIPILFAERIIDPKLPTVLFYFHFDGQAIDPSQWDQAHPFQPVLKRSNGQGKWEEINYNQIQNWDPEWRVFGRAAADDKGPIIMFLEALSIIETGSLPTPYNIKVLLDGEEEKGSGGLIGTLDKYRSIYKADRLIIMDGPAHPTNRPTLTFGCRGITSASLTVYGAKLAQHSGHYGNYVPNPVFRMANLLASMKDDEGRVLIEGFYDGIELDATTQAVLTSVPDDQQAIQRQLGIAAFDKVGKTYQEALQYPSLNVKGMASAWVGANTRTIVPKDATVQLGIRLVPETDGKRMLNLVKDHIQAQGYHVIDHIPTDEERLHYPKIATFNAGRYVNAFRTEIDSPTGQWLHKAILQSFGQGPVRIRMMGGTVPVVPIIEALGIPAVIVPMVNMDNNQHSPNENLRIGNLHTGIKTCISILIQSF